MCCCIHVGVNMITNSLCMLLYRRCCVYVVLWIVVYSRCYIDVVVCMLDYRRCCVDAVVYLVL